MGRHWYRCALWAGLFALLAPSAVRSATQKQRTNMAAHIVGLNMALVEAQRAGNLPADTGTLFPNITDWKTPGYTDACSTYLTKELEPADAAKVNFQDFIGYFEAGTSVTALGPTAFAATQEAIGALAFMPKMAELKPVNALGDPAGCLTGTFTKATLKALYLRHMRHMAASIATSLVKTRADNSDFAMILGVADSSTYDGRGLPSWLSPPAWQDMCYIADMDHPAADVAAQAAAALAMMSKVAIQYGNTVDQRNANVTWAPKAERAYAYAKKMWQQHGDESSCTVSAANENCVGTGCTKLQDNGKPVLTTCLLYLNKKGPEQHLFTAAAALWSLTGKQQYRTDADWYFDWSYGSFLYNWNNVLAQGIMIMAGAPDSAAAYKRKTFYQNAMRGVAINWSNCSNSGVGAYAGYENDPFCLKTPDGSAYPLDMPWGNLGTTMNGVCAAALYNHYKFDQFNKAEMQQSRCFMQRQLGYIFNHKCPNNKKMAKASCNTAGPEGFSYMVGVGNHYPTKIHSRDAGYPNFVTDDKPDGSTLCGGLVSGPYAPGEGTDGPVKIGTDVYTNDRRLWRESEAALDYTSSAICALMGYASIPDSGFTNCNARSPFTGRV